ncbi:MAG: competence type IV pilus major pilin ComGC [Erysipelotrichaceae bacterium]
MKKNDGFTLIEMIIVLAIICVVILLTIPNIQQKQEIVNQKGCEALIEVVNSQILLYEVANGGEPGSISVLISEGYLKESQAVCPSGESIVISNGQAGVS